ncbi:FERM, ARHGEF and pleckstrin domain-containing protein 2-like isoform X5 [Lineus longissimus]|uniref:FERM, ARHGEF and pleckstrin domain-containing protein 2-like isoform X5 n=1 Tax=Lineus longissimus TaxID=88925 RepID=UPI00315DE3A7
MSRPTSPPMSPRKGKFMNVKVLMLDNTVTIFQIPHKALGRNLYEEVINKLQVLESDYFDLEYINSEGITCWLDHDKPILKQVGSPHELNFRFGVKFYIQDPALLEEELTRYLFALQVKRDLQSGTMPCNENTAALLVSYITQAELGDYIDDFTDQSYLSTCKIVPNQTIEEKIIEYHKRHTGQTPADADFNLLDTARKVELYGIKMYPAKVRDHEGVPLNLAVAHMGVLVFQNYTKINTFSWAKVRKLSFKRKKFLIKLHPEGYMDATLVLQDVYMITKKKRKAPLKVMTGYYKDTVEFYFDTRNECKNFWKKCIEHHAFFRCHSVKRLPRNKTRVVSRGSSFRYGGRTQKQLVEFVRENYVKRAPFESPNTPRSRSRATTPGSRCGSRATTPSSMRSCPEDHAAQMAASLRRRMMTEHHRYQVVTNYRDVDNRSASARISSRSDGVTTKSSTLNSADMAYSHNSTSSGSHTLDMSSKDNLDKQPSTRIEMAEVHDDSSQSSRSISSPKRERLPPPPDDEFRMHRKDASEESLPPPPPPPPQDGTDVFDSDQNISMAQAKGGFDRKMSAPAFSIHQTCQKMKEQQQQQQHLERSPEVENIPEEVSFSKRNNLKPASPKFRRSHSDTPHESRSMERSHCIDEDDDEPPPPPPPLVDDDISPVPMYNRHGSPEPIEKPPPPVVRQETAPKAQGYDPVSPVPASQEETLTMTTTSRSHTLTNTLSSTTSRDSNKTDESEEERYPADKAYYIAKELLMTERTYKKDLEVLTVWFRNTVCHKELIPKYLEALMFSFLDEIYEHHCYFLKELEQRLAMWEGKSNAHLNGDYRKVGDLMLSNMKVLPLYGNYMEKTDEILTELDHAVRQNKQLETAYKEFESQKVCYLPLNTFLLKPAHRLLHYKLLLDRLLKHYSHDHPDHRDCKATLSEINKITEPLHGAFFRLENLQKLLELQRDLIGIENLVQPFRVFIREGCLQKLSRKGYQQRMFFLFSDMLIYTSRTTTPSLQFKVHGQIPLRGMIVEEADSKMAVANSFTIYGGNRCLLVAAGSPEEKDKWLEDLNASITAARERGDDYKYPSLKSTGGGSADDLLDHDGYPPTTPPMSEKQIQHRANTTMHVCWHRNTSVSMKDHQSAVENQLSGYVLRKFKNSNGWQKLWVVFTNFCLFFYKTFQDDFPLASLPLLGYSVNDPDDMDGIHKDYVFKLQFKNHVYFFRAESEYTFERWMEVIGSATNSAHLMRVFSRIESNNTR